MAQKNVRGQGIWKGGVYSPALSGKGDAAEQEEQEGTMAAAPGEKSCSSCCLLLIQLKSCGAST